MDSMTLPSKYFTPRWNLRGTCVLLLSVASVKFQGWSSPPNGWYTFNGAIFTRDARLITIFFSGQTYRYSRSEFARRRLLMLIVCAPRETAPCIGMRSPRLITNPSGNDHDTNRTRCSTKSTTYDTQSYILRKCSRFERKSNCLG